MNRAPSWVWWCAAGVVVAALGAYAYQRVYASERGAIDLEIERYRAGIADREVVVAGIVRERQRLRELAQRTLGSDEETVSASLRRALNEILAECELTDRQVVTRGASGVITPLAGVRVVEFETRDLRGRADFYRIPATISGAGTLEQVVRTIATVESQAWAHRIDSLMIEPVGRDRNRFSLSLSLETGFFADPRLRDGDGPPEPLWVPPAPTRLAAWRPFVEKNVFREPPAPRVVRQEPEQERPRPPAQPPEDRDWRVTGVVEGVSGAEIWLVNERTREYRVVREGESILGLTLVGVSGESARVEEVENGRVVEVRLGQTLSERGAPGQ